MNVEVYKRADGKWAWRIRAVNGQIIATDGGQGYSRRVDAQTTANQFLPTRIGDEDLWDFANDLLAAWNIEDTNSPSLLEDFRDRFAARFQPEGDAHEQA